MDRLKFILKKRDLLNQKRYYKNIEYPSVPIKSTDVYFISKVGDRLDIIAFDFYGDSRLWWIISKANPDVIRRDSFFINPGVRVRVPIDIQDIKGEYQNLNS